MLYSWVQYELAISVEMGRIMMQPDAEDDKHVLREHEFWETTITLDHFYTSRSACAIYLFVYLSLSISVPERYGCAAPTRSY